MVIAILVAFSFVMVGCHIIPVNWVVSREDQNLTRANSLQQIEFLRRIDKMSPADRQAFAKKGAELAISIEKIICGEAKDSPKLLEDVVKELQAPPAVEPPK